MPESRISLLLLLTMVAQLDGELFHISVSQVGETQGINY
jgi:hypothetical protein